MRDNSIFIKLCNCVMGSVTPYQVSNLIVSLIYSYACDNDLLKYKDKELLQLAKDMNSYLSESVTNKAKGVLSSSGLLELQEVVLDALSDSNSMLRYNDLTYDKSLFEVVYNILNIDGAGHSVYDMGSGNGNFLVNVYKKSVEQGYFLKELIGKEINKEQAEISKMALSIITNENVSFSIKIGNALDDEKFGCTKAFIFPPFGMKQLYNEKSRKSQIFSDIELSSRNSGEWLFIDKMLSQIGGQWSAVALVTAGSLYRITDEVYRSKLVQSGLVEAVISLPSGVLKNSGAKTDLLVFSEGNSKVKFIDASKDFKKINKLNEIVLLSDVILKKYNDTNCFVKTIDEFKETCNLDPARNLMSANEIENGVLLSDLADVFSGNQYTLGVFEKNNMLSNEKTGYCILTSSDIEDGLVSWNNLQSIKMDSDKFDKYCVQKNDIIVTSKSSKVKTVVVDIVPKEKIIVTGGMLIIRPKDDKVNSTYLKLFLDSEQGQQSLKAIQKGMIIVSINAKDLSNLIVPLIDIDKQEKKAERYNNMLSTLFVYKKEIKRLEEQIKTVFEDEMEEE